MKNPSPQKITSSINTKEVAAIRLFREIITPHSRGQGQSHRSGKLNGCGGQYVERRKIARKTLTAFALSRGAGERAAVAHTVVVVAVASVDYKVIPGEHQAVM